MKSFVTRNATGTARLLTQNFIAEFFLNGFQTVSFIFVLVQHRSIQ